MSKQLNCVIVGGGAAGFFAAIAAKAANPKASVVILDRSSNLLAKVRISGGGRCNVTHACYDPMLLVKNYPRGSKELIGPFTRFQPRDTVQWFESRGVKLKAEADGRIFPRSDSSSSIINCLVNETKKLGVNIQTGKMIQRITKDDSGFHLKFKSGETLSCDKLLLATGSGAKGHAFAKNLGHKIIEPVPSLFTFNVPDFPLEGLAGVAVEQAKLTLKGFRLSQTGPLLVTHWGFSGPAALKLSAWGARELKERKYEVQLVIDWLPNLSRETILQTLHSQREKGSRSLISSSNLFSLPKKLWKRLLERSGIDSDKKLLEMGNRHCSSLCDHLKSDLYSVSGKTTHKEEFVTSGGVKRSEVDFKTMESRRCKGLFFAGEILDIDGITGGFNFQNAWTTGWLAGNNMV